MASRPQDITFIVPAQFAATTARATVRGAYKTAVREGAGGTLRDGGQGTLRDGGQGTLRDGGQGTLRDGGQGTLRVRARPGEDVVVLTIADGPTLVLHPEDARDLMRAQVGAAPDGTDRSGASPTPESTRAAGRAIAPAGMPPQGDRPGATADDVVVQAQLGWPGHDGAPSRTVQRGAIGQALLSAFDVITDLAKDPAATLATAMITKKVDGQVDAGVYELSDATLPASLKGSGRKRAALPGAPDGGPLLVLVHGTFVDTVSTFGKLWVLHPQTLRALFRQYAGRVYALDHPTLGASPIANALTLVHALPAGARLHLVTHSRGGLVAEVLARACGGALPGAEALAIFKGEAYAQHRADLLALAGEARAKDIQVERFVRVACPSRGTLLASKRLDAYLSVLQWGLQLAGVPVAPQLVDFLHEVARRRADPGELPGLEAMMPSSPVVAWLNSGAEPIAGDLRVVAGDIEGDSVTSWVKTLLADAYYWTDNDLVVQTRSMYGGTPRAAATDAAGASFLLDSGGQVTHFNYFSNERTVQAISAALTEAQPAGFQPIGPLSWAGQDAGGLRGLPEDMGSARVARAVARSRGTAAGEGPTNDAGLRAGPAAAAPDRPAVFVLPGILGSNLKLDGERIWLGLRFVDGLKKLAWNPATANRIESDGPIASVYDELIESLADSHEVIPFAFDWRRPIEDEARRLAVAVDAALELRASSGQPVRLLAHSMGGLVARTMQLEAPATWQRLMAHAGARLLMLGTPNAGSWAPMQVLSGDDTFGNALVAFGALFDNRGARQMMAGLPGFLQLQAALLDPTLALARASTWQRLADDDMARLVELSSWHSEGPQRTVYEWGAPPQAVLDQAVALRRRLDAQVASLGADADKLLLVVGHADFTPDGFTIGTEGLEYLAAPDAGDGRVTLASARLPGVRTWKLDAAHGALPDVARAFPAFLELLTTGQTARLEALAPGAAASRGAPVRSAVRAHSRPSRGLLPSRPPSSASDVLGAARGAGPAPADRPRGGALRVSVRNGDLRFIAQPLLVGHYRSLGLTGTEWVVDQLTEHAMSRSLAAGLYPDAAGSHQIFGNRRADPDNTLAMARPQAVIVAGLGEEGKLRALDLVYTVRQAVLEYAQRVAEHDGKDAAPFELAATLLGSGGTGVNPGSAAQSIAQGAYEANQKLREGGWPSLSRLILVEFYLDRASEAWRALQVHASAAPNRLELVGRVESGPGALRRSLDSGYRGASYDFISALTGPPENGQPTLAYTLDTRRARAEVRAQQAQGTLLAELVAKASNDARADAQIGRTLFKLLVPVELEPFLGGTSEMLLELDAGSAVIPWELLDTDPAHGGGDPRPWAIRAKLLRKLRTEVFRAQVSDAGSDDSVLVIGAPLADPAVYPPLPGARAEALAVVARLGGKDGVPAEKLRSLTSGEDDARTVINALFERPYRVVHVAGHGAFGPRGGVVLSGNTFLGANEVEAMRTVPELVFLNCCHLAGREASTVLQPYDRAAFAANIAQALIEVGVRCVIAAGWAVEDGPAETFATTFYATLLRGEPFIEAVATAREAAWRESPQGNTWAAYQCYGDPGWTWSRGGVDAQRRATPLGDEFAAVSSPVALALALETLAIHTHFGGGSPTVQCDKLRYLEATFAPQWGGMGAVAEAFALAHAELRDGAAAIAWYRAALAANDGSASFRVAEQLGNQIVRHGEGLADTGEARRTIEEGITHLERLITVHATLERESLLGSAYKRLVLLEARAGRYAASLQALQHMATHYAAAEALARASGDGSADQLFYPAKNGVSAELRLAFLQRRRPRLSVDRFREVRVALERAISERPDFWSVAGQIELALLEALAQQRLAGAAPGLIDAFRELKVRVPAPLPWDSVATEARFTLEPYQRVASAPEARAAADVLKTLQALAAAP